VPSGMRRAASVLTFNLPNVLALVNTRCRTTGDSGNAAGERRLRSEVPRIRRYTMSMLHLGRTFFAAAIAAAAIALCVSAVSGRAPTRLVDEPPVRVSAVAPGVVLVDFGRVAFGNLRLTPPAGTSATVTVHFGEALAAGRVNRTPPGSVRYAQARVELAGAETVVSPPPDARNTRQVGPDAKPDRNGYLTPPAVLTPAAWGVVLPFRWVEIEGWPGELAPGQIRRQSAFAASWDDDAAAFRSSDDLLDRIWELCRYSIKATTFAGVYVDGDRERIPYEADAYLNQLSHYATDRDRRMARHTFDWLVQHPTWPTEWRAHMVFMAHADWMDSGDRAWLSARYDTLKSKLLLGRTRADGLVTSDAAAIQQGDLVDWPAGERDGFVFTPVNTVVNACHLRTLALMAELAGAIGRLADAEDYRAREVATRAVFQATLFDPARGVYRDGEGTEHASLHANLFPLAFGLVPQEERERVTNWLRSRGMACSVYAAQYLLEALFENGGSDAALALITAPTDRSWVHMLESGTTITWEAWDQTFKPNQDWNHAWGAAPANLLPRFVLGVQPLTPGWGRALVCPHPGSLTGAEGKVPTPRGPVSVSWTRGTGFRMELRLPTAVTARVELPARDGSQGVLVGGTPARARRSNGRWVLEEDVAGSVTIEER
jgi:alpha-L-rhamnosidase